MRAATPWGDTRVGTIITMADPMMNAIWENFVISESGEAPDNWRTVDEELVKQYDKIEEPKTQGSLIVNGAALSGYDDSDGLVGSMELRLSADALLSQFPVLADNYTKPEIARRLGLCGEFLPTNNIFPSPRPPHKECERLKKDIEDATTDYANLKCKYRKDPSGWVNAKKEIHNAAATASGVCDYQSCTEPDRFMVYLAKCEEILENAKAI